MTSAIAPSSHVDFPVFDESVEAGFRLGPALPIPDVTLVDLHAEVATLLMSVPVRATSPDRAAGLADLRRRLDAMVRRLDHLRGSRSSLPDPPELTDRQAEEARALAESQARTVASD